MARAALLLTAFLSLAAWAGAQGPPVLLAADQLRLLRANRTLLGQLVGSGVELGSTGDATARAGVCQRAAHSLADAVTEAAAADDPHRTAELGEHFEAVVRDGLVPTLAEARAVVPDDARYLGEVRRRAAGDVDGVRAALAAPGKVGTSAKVREIRDRLDALKERLK